MTTYHLTFLSTIIRRMTGVFSTVFAVFFIIAVSVAVYPMTTHALVIDYDEYGDDEEYEEEEPYCLYPGDDDEEFFVEPSLMSPSMVYTYAIDGESIVDGGTYGIIDGVHTESFAWQPVADIDFYILVYKGVRGENPILIRGYNGGGNGIFTGDTPVAFDPGEYFIVIYQSHPNLGLSYAGDLEALGVPAFDNEYHQTLRNFFASGDVRRCFPDFENSSIPPAEYEAWGIMSFTVTGKTQTLPTLSYIPTDSYATDAHIAGRGVEPNKGVADKDSLTFATLYTDQDSDTPAYVRLWVKDATGTDTFYNMTRETGAHAPASHTDGNTQNGEQYTFTGTFPKGIYSYAFLTADMHDGNPGEEVSFPAPLSGVPTDNPLSFTTGYSNVAFLPGIGGSRLYADYGVGEMLWEPDDIADVAEIRLDTDTHESVNPSIVVSGITDEILLRLDAWPTTNVYKTFMQFMDTQVVGAGIINTWKPLAYDWRLGLDALVTRGTHIDTRNGNDVISYNITTEGTSTPYLLSELRHLADTSDSGKVSLVTHSNGGLLAKYILKHLADTHDPLLDRIDTVMLVASPQWGTPEAAATLLHGTTKIGKGMERDTAETLPSAYHLLPSEAYLEHVQTPVFVFDPEVSSIPDLVDFAGRAIGGSGAYTAFTDFMTGHAGTWTEPIDVDAPNVLDTELLTYAKDIHEALDTWTPPAHVRVVQIAGWGIDTIRGIAYDNCDIPFCPQTLSTLDRTLQKTTLGDGTVVLPSAIAMSGGVETYFLDLESQNKSGVWGTERNRKHSSILEVNNLKDFLKNVFTNTDLLPAYISTIEPTSSLASKALHFTMHSPVAVHLYDAEGNHTGIVPNPNTASDIRVYEENIPNSYYEEWGETKYIGVSGEGPITLVLDGEGSGTFTLEIEETQGDETTAYTVFTDVPVSATSAGSFTIASVSGVGILTLDNNGDGTPDVYAFTDEMKEVIDYGILKEAVQALSSNQKKTLLTQITLMEALHKRGAVIAEKALLRVFKKHIETLVNPKLPAKTRITVEEKVKIDAIVTVLFEQLEEPIKKRKNDIQENIKKLRERIVNELRK